MTHYQLAKIAGGLLGSSKLGTKAAENLKRLDQARIARKRQAKATADATIKQIKKAPLPTDLCEELCTVVKDAAEKKSIPLEIKSIDLASDGKFKVEFKKPKINWPVAPSTDIDILLRAKLDGILHNLSLWRKTPENMLLTMSTKRVIALGGYGKVTQKMLDELGIKETPKHKIAQLAITALYTQRSRDPKSQKTQDLEKFLIHLGTIGYLNLYTKGVLYRAQFVSNNKKLKEHTLALGSIVRKINPWLASFKKGHDYFFVDITVGSFGMPITAGRLLPFGIGKWAKITRLKIPKFAKGGVFIRASNFGYPYDFEQQITLDLSETRRFIFPIARGEAGMIEIMAVAAQDMLVVSVKAYNYWHEDVLEFLDGDIE